MGQKISLSEFCSKVLINVDMMFIQYVIYVEVLPRLIVASRAVFLHPQAVTVERKLILHNSLKNPYALWFLNKIYNKAYKF